MPSQNETPEHMLRELSALLGLNDEPQDWGIVNADGDRLEEFVDCFESTKLSPTQRFHLAELVLASANERLLAGNRLDTARLRRLCGEEPVAFKVHLDYWRGLADHPDFPLGRELRRTLGPDS